MPAILAVDDDKDLLLTFQSIFKKHYKILTASSGAEALTAISKVHFPVVLLDVRMPGLDGIESLKAIKKADPGTEVIMVTASKDINTAVEAMKAGAFDYIIKPFEKDELLIVVKKALEKHDLGKENTYLKETLKSMDCYCNIIARSHKMKKLFSQIDKIGPTDSRVLISGQSGSGKELVARAIHHKSKRKDQPFVALNCAAIPDNLFESELFGHERGAFTGAMERRIGKFELANNGTLFLDEIGCMPASMQAKLLRVLEHPYIERLGGEQSIEINVRIISATNIDFKKHLQENKFREDLYYRLNVIPLNLPSLKERKEDIPLLLEHFIDKFNKQMNKCINGFTPRALEILCQYLWPGNVRELQNCVERLVALADKNIIHEDELDFVFPAPEPHQLVPDLRQSMDNFEKERILSTLSETHGNITQAARSLNLARSTLTLKMKNLNINAAC